MDSNDTPKPIDYVSMLAAMEAQYAALAAAIPTMRVLASLSGALVPDGGFSVGQSNGPITPGEIPPGTFHGRSIPEGSMLFLRMVRQKQKAAAIADALQRGGYQTNSQDFKNQVHAALDRASKKDGAEIIKLENAYWGLREWLSPNVRATMAARPPANSKKAKRPKKRKSISASSAALENSEVLQPKPNGHGAPPAEKLGPKLPDADTTEGRILEAMRRQSSKSWTPEEVAAAADITPIRTARFLLGKLAFRKVIRKSEDGSFRIQ